ncbi:phosphoglycerate mutase-like protein [Cadophora sp. DSE1049]|nr:phosphoglycerate mutase-like protein [Cadophora sp. DSE1049]
MAPTIILIRHAEAIHNITKDYTIHDPPLTEHGLTTQCSTLSRRLQESLPLANQIDLIVVSPMQRTLQTAAASLNWLTARGIKTIALAELQETTTNAIDIGRPIEELTRDWPNIDWSAMDPIFPSKEGLYAFSAEALLRRGAAARKWLRSRPEKVIAVVGHAGFMRIGLCNRKFDNADWRVFEFENVDGEEGQDDGKGLRLVEWEETERNGGGLGTSQKGFFGWEVHDFKYMPGNEGKTKEELEELCVSTPLR